MTIVGFYAWPFFMGGGNVLNTVDLIIGETNVLAFCSLSTYQSKQDGGSSAGVAIFIEGYTYKDVATGRYINVGLGGLYPEAPMIFATNVVEIYGALQARADNFVFARGSIIVLCYQ